MLLTTSHFRYCSELVAAPRESVSQRWYSILTASADRSLLRINSPHKFSTENSMHVFLWQRSAVGASPYGLDISFISSPTPRVKEKTKTIRQGLHPLQ